MKCSRTTAVGRQADAWSDVAVAKCASQFCVEFCLIQQEKPLYNGESQQLLAAKRKEKIIHSVAAFFFLEKCKSNEGK